MTAYIALGSNLGDRLGQMRTALGLLEVDYDLTVLKVSSVYENRAIGMGDQAGPFLNGAVSIQTALKPEALLDACLAVENQLGRVRTGSWTSRTIDLDILAYADLEIDTERLQLPHPRITERDFVAKPLMDLDSDLVVFGQSIRVIVEALPSIDLKLWPEVLR